MSIALTRCLACVSRTRTKVQFRSLVSSHITTASFASQSSDKISALVSIPNWDQLKEDDPDAEYEHIPAEKARLEITERAAEQLRQIATREANRDAALRIAVESGGCHGYQYKMELAKRREPDDYHFSHPKLVPSNILVDATSLDLLNGSTVDFATELIGSSFRVLNNPNAKGSGCGCGVSWEAKI